jgi:hypothetical protein
VLERKESYTQPRSAIEREYALETTVRRYESLFERLTGAATAQQQHEEVA